MAAPDKIAAIRGKAELLAGAPLGDGGDALIAMAVQRACAYCGRTDVPEDMEQAVASLALTMTEGGGTVKSVTRGDTSVTYAVSAGQAGLEGLNPWRRLGAPRPDGEGERP